jgi:FxsC-like protein
VNWVGVNAGLVAALERVEQENAVVVVVVDPWTALHPAYKGILSQFDRYQFRNCVVLIPWNRSDPSTHSAGDRLKAALTQALARNFEGRKEVFFRHNIEARADLRDAISRALADLEALLAPRREPARKLDSSPQTELPQANASAATS